MSNPNPDNPFRGLIPGNPGSSETSDSQSSGRVSQSSDTPPGISKGETDVISSALDKLETGVPPPTNFPAKRSMENESESKRLSTEKDAINLFFERVFLITMRKDTFTSLQPPALVYTKGVVEMFGGQEWLDTNILDQAVFERLTMENPAANLYLNKDSRVNLRSSSLTDAAQEKQVVTYLFQCYERYMNVDRKNVPENAVTRCHNAILTNMVTLLVLPTVYPNPPPYKHFLHLMLENCQNEVFLQFLGDLCDRVELSPEEANLRDMFLPVLDHANKYVQALSVVDTKLTQFVRALKCFCRKPALGLLLLEHSTPRQRTNGKVWQSTVLGCVFSKSILPPSEVGPFEYFEQPSRSSSQEHEITERNLWMPLSTLSTELYHLVYTILKLSPDCRHQMLTWISSCLHENKGRAKLWNTQMGSLMASTFISDGFLLNLGSVLLHLCQPFSSPSHPHLARVDPTYCSTVPANAQDIVDRNIHLSDLNDETCLVPPSDGENSRRPTLPLDKKFSFITECFFLTHRCLTMGFHALYDRFLKINMELRRLQRIVSDSSRHGEESSTMDRLRQALETGTSLFLCMKCVLLEPSSLEMMLNFHIATATWLSNLAVCASDPGPALGTGNREELFRFCPIKFPLPEKTSEWLTCVPEFTVDNLGDFLTFLKRFNPKMFELSGPNLHHIMTFILVYMGSPERMRNPHLRAKLAEVLEALMPHEDEMQGTYMPAYHRAELFNTHPHIEQLAPTLVHVFVSIEMTGQSVAFEQKFNYRRPMYIVMDYMWKQEIHRRMLKQLAHQAEETLEATQPPLFLRFINLLINDAIFLLDEALMYMSRLREMQRARDANEWQSLPSQQREENEGNFYQSGMLARFHNVMANETIHILELLTSEIKSIFTHSTMVNRVAGMLNYFLIHLVGPKSRDLKVRDLSEYEFNPQKLVTDICRIYLHLRADDAFCLTVANDGRSYSKDLFTLAEGVLIKIGQGTLAPEIQELGIKINRLAEKHRLQEESLADAPDEFLDPILGTVMTDPVLLPSSNVIVDRSTIARHLLSDQSDPFNRSYLTMDLIKPATELQQRIQAWLEEIRLKTAGHSQQVASSS